MVSYCLSPDSSIRDYSIRDLNALFEIPGGGNQIDIRGLPEALVPDPIQSKENRLPLHRRQYAAGSSQKPEILIDPDWTGQWLPYRLMLAKNIQSISAPRVKHN